MSSIAEVNTWVLESCDRYMSPLLTRYGFRECDRESDDVYGARVTYLSTRLAVRVQFEACDPSILLWFIRCRDNKVPRYMEHVFDYMPITAFLQLHRTWINSTPKSARDLFDRNEVHDCIRSCADAMSGYASTMLRGDTSEWADLQERIRRLGAREDG